MSPRSNTFRAGHLQFLVAWINPDHAFVMETNYNSASRWPALTTPRFRGRDVYAQRGVPEGIRVTIAQQPAAGSASFTNSVWLDLSWVRRLNSFERIRLHAGDWRKGRIKTKQAEQIDFFSDQPGDAALDWKYIYRNGIQS